MGRCLGPRGEEGLGCEGAQQKVWGLQLLYVLIEWLCNDITMSITPIHYTMRLKMGEFYCL